MVRKIGKLFKPEKNSFKNREKESSFYFQNLNKTPTFAVLKPFNSKVQNRNEYYIQTNRCNSHTI